LFYQDTFKKDDKDNWKYCGSQARFLAVVDQDNEFIEDPDDDIIETEWINIDQITDYLDWGQTGPFLKELLERKLSL
jgi:hypothetical protein